MPAQFVSHPDPTLLSAYHLGKLSGEEALHIEEHLRQCDSCCEKLADPPNDSLVHLLKSARSVATRDQDNEINSNSSQTVASPTNLAVADSNAEQSGTDTVSEQAVPLPELMADHPKYEIMQLIGKGGMGNVYAAEHSLMKRPVAVKLINQKMVKNPDAVERFRREVQLAARLAHPNIVAAFDAEQIGEHHFLVMEYIEGADLEEVVKKKGPLPVETACDYIRQAALGLQHAFEYETIHRDIKPGNLMVTPQGEVKILDFGLAKFVSETTEEVTEDSTTDASEPGLTRASTMLGTPDYMAPEQQDRAHTNNFSSVKPGRQTGGNGSYQAKRIGRRTGLIQLAGEATEITGVR